MDQQEREQLQAQISALLAENESIKQQNQELQRELNNLESSPAPQLPDLYPIRDRVLKSLTVGKGKVATTSPQYKTAVKVLDRFIFELKESSFQSSTQSSTPTNNNE